MSPWYNVGWAVVLLPLLGSLASFLFETPRRAAHAVIACNGLGFVCSVFLFFFRFAHRNDAVSDGVFGFLQTTTTGGPGTSGLGSNLQPQLGVRVDSFGVVFAMAILFIGTLVLIHGLYSMRGDAGFRRVYWVGSLVIFGSVALAVSPNLFQALFAGMVLSAAVYVLSSHWWETHDVARMAQRGFGWLVAADVALLFAAVAWFVRMSSDISGQTPPSGQSVPDPFDFSLIGSEAARVNSHLISGVGGRSLAVVGILIVVAALIRCAVVPAVVWLTSVREAPLPAIALILSIGMGSGVILLLKSWALLIAVPHLMSIVAVIAVLSALICAVVVLTLTELAGICVWMAAAQIGLVVAAAGMGAFAPSAEMLLFVFLTIPVLVLSCGNLVRGYRSRDISEIGGAWQRMRATTALLLAWGVATFGATFSIYNFISAASRNTVADQSGGTPLHAAEWARDIVIVAGSLSALLIVLGGSRLLARLVTGVPAPRRGFAVDRIRDVERLGLWPIWVLVAGVVMAITYGIPAMYKGITLSHFVYFGKPGQLPQSLPIVGPAVAAAIVIALLGVVGFIYFARRDFPMHRTFLALGRNDLAIDRAVSWGFNRVTGFAGDLFLHADEGLFDPLVDGAESAAVSTGDLAQRARTSRLTVQLAVAFFILALVVAGAAFVAHSGGGR